jgi:hypothetical protein
LAERVHLSVTQAQKGTHSIKESVRCPAITLSSM